MPEKWLVLEVTGGVRVYDVEEGRWSTLHQLQDLCHNLIDYIDLGKSAHDPNLGMALVVDDEGLLRETVPLNAAATVMFWSARPEFNRAGQFIYGDAVLVGLNARGETKGLPLATIDAIRGMFRCGE